MLMHKTRSRLKLLKENLMFKDNLIQLRKMKRLTQEDIAEKLDVTRQAVAKWESGETMPDIEKSRQLAEKQPPPTCLEIT